MKRRIKNTLLFFILLFLLYLFTSCKTRTVYVPVESKITIRETETIKDTVVDVRLIPYYSETETEKDSSYLENDYAYSKAVWSGKKLFHNLGIHNKDIPVKIHYKDRNVYIHDSVNVPYPLIQEKEVYRLTSFQTFQLWCGRILILLIVFLLLFISFKRFL